jgi:hypothetical protein
LALLAEWLRALQSLFFKITMAGKSKNNRGDLHTCSRGPICNRRIILRSEAKISVKYHEYLMKQDAGIGNGKIFKIMDFGF